MGRNTTYVQTRVGVERNLCGYRCPFRGRWLIGYTWSLRIHGTCSCFNVVDKNRSTPWAMNGLMFETNCLCGSWQALVYTTHKHELQSEDLVAICSKAEK